MSQPLSDRLNYHATHRSRLLGRPGRLVEQRLEVIRQRIDLRGNTVLDLGCSGGYFSFNLAHEAKQVVGVDGDRELIGQNVALAHRLGVDNVQFIHASLTPQFVSALPEFDVVLFMSVFHHMLTASNAYSWNSEPLRHEAFATLREIQKKARILVFEMGYPDEGYDWSSKLPPMVPDPVQWIQSNILGEGFSVQVVPAPALKGPIGWGRKMVLDNRHRDWLVWRILRRLLGVDVRDRRHLFIGTKRV